MISFIIIMNILNLALNILLVYLVINFNKRIEDILIETQKIGGYYE